jgi:adenine deaminase
MSNSSRYLLVKAQNAILSFKHDKGPAEVLIDRETGKIVEVALGHKTCEVQESQVEIIQLEEDQVLMPGLVDAHGKKKGIKCKKNALFMKKKSPFKRARKNRMGRI